MHERLLRRILTAAALTAVLFAVTACGETSPEERLDDTVAKLGHAWRGTASLLNGAGDVRTYQSELLLAETAEGRCEGTFVLHREGEEPLAAPVALERSGGVWRARWGDADLTAKVPDDVRGKLEKRAVLWLGDGDAFRMAMDREAMQMTLDGEAPLPGGLGGEETWVSARYRRDGFRLPLGVFEITVMECFGLLATLVFGSRFMIQWIASERAKRSVVPELFWWVSLLGACLMLIYGVYFGRLAVVLGQISGWAIYIRNIWLIEKHKRQAHAPGDPEGSLLEP